MAKKKVRQAKEINASSMADIAFLLLIFFLVTTEISVDEGIKVNLPPWSDDPPPPVEQNDRNTLTVLINSLDQLLVEEELFDVNELRAYGKTFVDNQGRDPSLSDSPLQAIISFKGDRGTSYEMYIRVYNELRGVYNDLRNDLTRRETAGRVSEFSDLDKSNIDSLIYNKVRLFYPIRLSEAEPTEFGAKK